MKRPLAASVIAIIALLLSACGQEGLYSGTLITEGEHTIESGQVVDGEMILMGGRIALEEGSQATGSVHVLGGLVEADGEIGGDLSMIDGEVVLGPNARVGGDLNVSGGELARSAGSEIAGEVNTGVGSGIRVPFFPEWTILPAPEDASVVGQITGVMAEAVLTAVLALLAVRFVPHPVSRVAGAVAKAPVLSGALGLLAMIVVPSLLVLMAFTLILIPVALLGALLLGVVILYGWISIGSEIGRRLARRLEWNVRLPAAAFLGTLLFVLLVNASGLIPVVRVVVPVLAAAVGFGAVLLTRFGMMTFVPSTDAERTGTGSP
jgi:hypothetical protein